MTKQLKLDERIEILQSVAGSLLEEIKLLKLAADFEVEDGIDFYETIGRYEAHLIQNALEKAGGNQAKAARMLNLKPSTLNMKMKNLRMI